MKQKQQPSELREAIASLRPFFVRSGWFSLVCSLLVLAPSGYMLEVYDRVVNSRSHTTLVMLTLLVLGAYVVMEVLEWARSEVMRAASVELDHKMSTRIFNAIFEANLRRLPGGTQQPLNDFRQVRDFLYSPVLLALLESPISLVMMVLLFLISPVLGWSALVFAVLQTLVAWLNERSTQPPLMQANRAAIEAQQYADNTLRNAEVIESMGMLRDTHRRWLLKQRDFLDLQALASERAGGFQAISKLLQNTLSSLLLGLGCWLLLHNELNGGGGMMIVASILGGRMLAPLVQVVSQWQTVVNARDAWARLDGLLAAVPARPPGMALPAPRGALQVEQLVAGAPGSPAPILRGVQFALAPGEVLAVVGPSAAGKTTLARLLVGLWPAQGGKVRLDGADIHTWNKAELGAHLGYLPQGVELFEGTLAENIARFAEVEPAKVEAAARAVGLHEFILSLPLGYDSPVGPEGARLSGGQRQRVGLARALYGDPVFVVLDEPNSSLDEEGDAALARAIQESKARGTTFVVMTHRTSVLAVADKMLVLRDGMQQAFGPRDEVLAALHQAQQQAQQPAAPAARGPALAAS
ncbi:MULTISPECIES: type I secretion system permease/ATPase [unclassified Acidovorax]|jgi:ATP-binding cassette subfamily C exporter for protease/lipase|uniref:type I secretion system permease/ATPase n=1 Tax=unclassified Acidovorax TaxID=2684926 RepID=UPI000BCE7084|nr:MULTISPECIES: type I secretion system permease/ATPase [unclassified Acidovorax]OZA57048.1 MAG: type I secretion system permease/ATPase [Acidovorax sp. 17-64-282]HQS20088.1 type I secretion system permease/ATPase [Acidovorax defluvii]OYY27661.1 MAG: type I secretion system permease/ATPase [Acidovorax sp. 35-64-16]OYY83121.1 MAG: type I secretion system permease/ATPase [Acidovorax sp. 28-64-14]OYZ43142.1 MAG: type I secretion system permease/ATPase [Acidovorax sp. 16-64-162]